MPLRSLVPSVLLAALGLGGPVHAAADTPEPEGSEQVESRRFRAPPMRAGARMVFREQMGLGLRVEAGVQFWRTRRLTLDGLVSYTFDHPLGTVGPWRVMGGLDALVDLGVELGPWVTVGPSAGLAFRMYRQQGTAVSEVFTPVAGLRAAAFVMRSRTWGMQLTVKGMADLRKTELVLADSSVQVLSPLAVEAGVHFVFGHGRVR